MDANANLNYQDYQEIPAAPAPAPGGETAENLPVDIPIELDAEMRRLFNSQAALVMRLTSLLGLSLLVVLVLAIGCAYLWWRSPEVITWKEDTEGKTMLTVNNRSYGDVANLSMRPQGESQAEKIFAAKELTRLLYNINPDTRQSALQRVLDWFPQDAARTRDAFANALKQIGNDPNACVAVGLESSQKWQSTFTVQEAGVANENPALIRIIGVQRLRRAALSNDIENRLLAIDMELISTGNRTDNNFMTGYEPKYIMCKVLPSATAPAANQRQQQQQAAPQLAPSQSVAPETNQSP